MSFPTNFRGAGLMILLRAPELALFRSLSNLELTEQ